MRPGPVRGAAGARVARERAARRAFGEQLDRARRSGPQDPRRPEAPLLADTSIAGETRVGPGATLQRRRTMADAHDDGLSRRRRDIERSEQAQAPRPVPEGLPSASPADEGSAPTTLVAAVRRLALELSRREAAEGHSLEMRFGATLRIRLTQAGRTLRIDMAGDRAAARLARAEMPGILAALRARGLSVSRAEVREAAVAGKTPGADDLAC